MLLTRLLFFTFVFAADSGVSGDAEKRAVCEFLAKIENKARFPVSQKVLCGADRTTCASLNEKQCEKRLECQATKGSSSGAGCSPCLLDHVFWRCENRNEKDFIKLLTQYRACIKFGAQWKKGQNTEFGQCSCPNSDHILNVNLGCQAIPEICKAKGGSWKLPVDPSTHGTSRQCFIKDQKLEFQELFF